MIKIIKENKVFYPNGVEVSDTSIDLSKALDFMYGTDRDKDIKSYTQDMKQRAINYWIKKTDGMLKEGYNRKEIISTLSLDTPADEVKFLINNVFYDKYVQKIIKLLGREDNADGYPLRGKEGIDYEDASDSVKKSIINLIKQDNAEFRSEYK